MTTYNTICAPKELPQNFDRAPPACKPHTSLTEILSAQARESIDSAWSKSEASTGTKRRGVCQDPQNSKIHTADGSTAAQIAQFRMPFKICFTLTTGRTATSAKRDSVRRGTVDSEGSGLRFNLHKHSAVVMSTLIFKI